MGYIFWDILSHTCWNMLNVPLEHARTYQKRTKSPKIGDFRTFRGAFFTKLENFQEDLKSIPKILDNLSSRI